MAAVIVRWVVFRGQRRSIADLAKEHGIDRRTLRSRLDAGETIEEALRPVRAYPENVVRGQEKRTAATS